MSSGGGGAPQVRRRKPAMIKAVEELDAFPKVPETCIETTSYGGTASVVAVFFIVWLSLLELRYFIDTGYKFKFTPDTHLDEKLTIHVDITVAMPCSLVGADIVDSTNQNVMKFGELEEEYVHFDLSDSQRAHFNAKAQLNSYLREQYHSLQDLLWKTDFVNSYTEMPKLTSKEKIGRGPAMSCRLHGSLVLNKVAGNFHIIAGKSLPLPRGHAHIAAFMSDRDYNFSHRIYKFAFGDGMPSIIHPLEGDEKVTRMNHMAYQYFIQVVPTVIKTRFRTYRTFQYSVREMSREIDHDKGSHGMTGIFFKYDMSGLRVEVNEEEYPWWRFLIRLCAVVGGVYATVGMVYNLLSLLGCTVKKLRESPADFTRNKKQNQYSSPPAGSDLIGPAISGAQSPLLQAANADKASLNFNTMDVQFVGQNTEPMHSQSQLCDIAADSSHSVTSLKREGVPFLPDLLSSHSST